MQCSAAYTVKLHRSPHVCIPLHIDKPCKDDNLAEPRYSGFQFHVPTPQWLHGAQRVPRKGERRERRGGERLTTSRRQVALQAIKCRVGKNSAGGVYERWRLYEYGEIVSFCSHMLPRRSLHYALGFSWGMAGRDALVSATGNVSRHPLSPSHTTPKLRIGLRLEYTRRIIALLFLAFFGECLSHSPGKWACLILGVAVLAKRPC